MTQHGILPFPQKSLQNLGIKAFFNKTHRFLGAEIADLEDVVIIIALFNLLDFFEKSIIFFHI